MHIAICDDDLTLCERVARLLQNYNNERQKNCMYHIFTNGFDLLDSLERQPAFDVILLDIVMPGMNGIQIAKEIRRSNETVKIIFLTTSAEFAVDSYAVGAFYYLLKPLDKDLFFQILDKTCYHIQQEETQSILLNDGKTIRRLPLHHLVYCETMQRTLYYYLTDGSVVKLPGTLGELEQQLLHVDYFAKPHRSYLLNLKHVSSIRTNELTTILGNKLPLARGRYHDLTKAYLAQAFSEDKR